MNAQEAVKKINSGMDALTLPEVIEVYNALNGNTQYANEFGLVNGFAKSKLATYANSTDVVQSKMNFADADALRDLVDNFGWDDKNNLTEDGRKALEIAARVSKRIKDEQLLNLLDSKESADKKDDKKKDEPVLLTDAQKRVLDEHGFMYDDTVESLGKYQSADAALKVLKDEGLFSENKKNPKQDTPKSQEKTPEEKGKEFKGTPLTPEQIRVLDAHGFMHDGTLESLGWFKDKNAALKVLKDEGVLDGEQKVEPAVAEVKDEPKVENKPVNEEGLSAAQINKNMEQLDSLSGSINPLDEKDERFAESRQLLNVMDVRDENGKEYDVKPELVELAKLQTERDLHDAKKITAEDYVERLKFNIDSAVYSVIAGNGIDFSRYNGDENKLRETLERDLNKYIEAGKKDGKENKAHVRLESVLGYMSQKSHELDSFADGLKQKFGELPFVTKFKGKIQAFDQKCEAKFGQKTWNKVRGFTKIAESAGPDLAMAAVAGLGGPLGLAAYGAYAFNRHVMPFINRYMDQPKTERTGFRKYIKTNKKDAVWAGLYTASAGLTLGMAAVQGVASIATATAAATGQTLDVTAKAAILTKHMSIGKAVTAGTTMLSRYAVKIGESVSEGDSKATKRNVIMAVGSAALFAGGYALRHWLGMDHGSSKETPAATDTQTGEKVFPIVDRDGDGIPDTIDRDGGDGWANGPDITPIDDFYHGAGVEAKSHESIIRLLTNSQVSRSEATLKAQMMLERIAGNETLQATFPSASDAQLAHAILLRASDVRKVDADELLRAFLGDGNCTKLTMEQQISEIHKGLTGYNYGQRTDLPYGRNLDPNYVGLNTRSRFLLEDCDSERQIDKLGGGRSTTVVQEETTATPVKKTVVSESSSESTDVKKNTTTTITEEKKVVVQQPQTRTIADEPAPAAATPAPAQARVLAEGEAVLNGAKKGVEYLNRQGFIKLKDADGISKWYVATPEERKALNEYWDGVRSKSK